ncbi:MAG: type VI secretion system baseplate subunit TssK [Acidobacteriota bacterium]|nr:type VI secretion system baseplate subunit TssK [Acidobacteriota bacterium]
MKSLSRVVWSEGMFLGTHHFQAQNRYFEDLIQFASSSLWFEPYGFLGCELDAEALRNGTVSVVSARGIFPDGLVFHMPESDPLPEPRDIGELFPPTQRSLGIALAVPAYKRDGLNCVLAQNGSDPATRFVARPRTLADENTGRDEKTLQLGFKNIRLLLETESSEGMVTLPLARVTRDGSGRFVYDSNFIPPSLDVAANDHLLGMIRKMVEDLEERSRAISGAGNKGGKLATGLSAMEVANFWYLHSINASLAPLRHFYAARRGHPEQVFLELSRLAGALCTFKAGSHPQDIPLYDHQNLEGCFTALEEHIRSHLLTIFPENYVAIPLKPAAKYFYEGEIRDQRCLDRARWIFGVHSEMGEVDLIALTPKIVKICSGQFVVELVKRAVPGLVLTHLASPPAAVSPKVTNQYFSVNLAGPCWEHIVKTRRVGIYVPGEIPNPELELRVLLEGQGSL